MESCTFIESTTGLEFNVVVITDEKLILINDTLALEYSCKRTESWDVIRQSIETDPSKASIKFDTNYYILALTVGNVQADLTPYMQLYVDAPAPYYDVCSPPNRNKSDLEQSIVYDMLGLLYNSYAHRINAYLREQALRNEIAELNKKLTEQSYSIEYIMELLPK